MTTLTVKIMSDQNIADDDSRKDYLLYSGVASVEFRRTNVDHRADSDVPRAWAHLNMANGDGFSIPVNANAYVMNDAGKTISSYGAGRHPGEDRVGSTTIEAVAA